MNLTIVHPSSYQNILIVRFIACLQLSSGLTGPPRSQVRQASTKKRFNLFQNISNVFAEQISKGSSFQSPGAATENALVLLKS